MKNNLRFTGLILCGIALLLIGGSVGFFAANNKMAEKKEAEKKQEEVTNGPKSYTVSLSDSENFSVVAETYNNDNNLNLVITSKNTYSYVWGRVDCYDENDKLINELFYSSNFVTAGDEYLVNLELNAKEIKSIIVNTFPSDDKENLIFHNKKEIKFDVIDTKVENGVVVDLKAINPFKTNLLFVKGYVVFYNNGKLVYSEPFEVGAVAENGEIVSKVNANFIDEYNSIKVIVNEIV